MYAVSDKFLKAINASSRTYSWKGTITLNNGNVINFDENDILKGSGYINRQCCGSSEIEIGSVYAAEAVITLFTNADRYSFYGALLSLTFSLKLSNGTYEDVPMGLFEISEANRHIRTVDLKGYDYMLRFDKTFNATTTTGTPYELLNGACLACEVQLGMSEDEVMAFPNGEMTLGLAADNEVETWRDLIFYVAQVLCACCMIDRQGRLVLLKYGDTSVCDIPVKERYSSEFSDFVTRYTAINLTNMSTQTAEYYSLETDDALTMNLGVNPFLQLGLKETREEAANNILNALAIINYVPFSADVIGNPALDPGDIITFSGGHADGHITCITSLSLKINGRMTLKCVGANPRLINVKSKSDKNISGLINQLTTKDLILYSFTNASKISVKDKNTQIAMIGFVTNSETFAQFQAEIHLTVTPDKQSVSLPVTYTKDSSEGTLTLTYEEDAPVTLNVSYMLNGSEINLWKPVETYTAGDHILSLYYAFQGVKANTNNLLGVYLNIENGTAEIPAQNVIATIIGQGLAGAEVWDGTLTFEDTFDPVVFGNNDLEFDSFNETVTPVLPSGETPAITESIQDITFGDQPQLDVTGFSVHVLAGLVITSFTVDAVKNLPEYNSDLVKITSNSELMLQTDFSFESEEAEVDSGNLSVTHVALQDNASVESVEVK